MIWSISVEVMIEAYIDNDAKSQKMNCSLNKIYQVLKDNVLNRCQSSDGKSRMLLGVSPMNYNIIRTI